MSNQTQQHEQQAGQAFSQDEFSALLNKEFRPKTDQARSAVESAVKTLAQQALENTVTFSNDTYRTIQNLIAGIDEQLSQQVNQIIHHDEFQKLESAWRGLSYLVNNTETDEMLKIRFMSISKQELGRTLKRFKGVGWDQSPIFKKIYEQEYGQFGGEPFGCIVGDYYFDHSPQDVELLGESDEGLEVRYSWVTWSHRYQHTDAYFGSTCCTLIESAGKPQIIRKTVRLNNDYIRQVIDVYHI